MKKTISIFSVILSITGLIWLLGQGIAIGRQTDTAVGVGKALPAFEAVDVKTNKTVTKQSLLGKARIVHVWASWCGPCIEEHGLWLKMNGVYPDSVVGILYRDNPERAKAFLEKKEDPYYYLIDDSQGSLGLKLGIRGTPETFIIDKKGIIRYHYTGSFSRSVFEKEFLPVFKKLWDE